MSVKKINQWAAFRVSNTVAYADFDVPSTSPPATSASSQRPSGMVCLPHHLPSATATSWSPSRRGGVGSPPLPSSIGRRRDPLIAGRIRDGLRQRLLPIQDSIMLVSKPFLY
ncbi:hypothetical protein AALO_G00142300 [Alosa alosa]|uniref:Uncharacterized protein n=1 Tax=Alosa alosa TaxID=278164 RepID=A0AAV6GIH5_9TELE|nr:hypothetical protein AALO_G00142300 [Alosa alosa]